MHVKVAPGGGESRESGSLSDLRLVKRSLDCFERLHDFCARLGTLMRFQRSQVLIGRRATARALIRPRSSSEIPA